MISSRKADWLSLRFFDVILETLLDGFLAIEERQMGRANSLRTTRNMS